MLLTTISVVAFAAGTAPPTDQPAEPGDAAVLDRFQVLGEQMEGLDWNREYPGLQRALWNIWVQNGWDDEADRYAYELAREVVAIPPWQAAKRLDVVMERLGERYGMSRDEVGRVKGTVIREVGGILWDHAGVLIEQTREVLSARAEGRPYTAEQIARWTQASAPVWADLRSATDRVVAQLEPVLSPEARRILERDMKSYRKRLTHFDEMSVQWAQGKWQASDWGLQHDPIQRGAVSKGPGDGESPVVRRGAGRGPSEGGTPRWKAHDPSTWSAYVADFTKRFNLDPGQATAAQSIHDELVARANDYLSTRAEEVEKIPLHDRATHEAYEPVRTLFREMQERLDAVPTSGQRDRNQPSSSAPAEEERGSVRVPAAQSP